MTELALTRIFSVVMYYHFAFLAISIALFGLSASGVYAYLRRRRARPAADRDAAGPPVADLRDQHDRRALRAGPPAGRPQLFAREPRADADDLRARRAPVLHRRTGHHARHRRLATRINAVYAADLIGAALGCLVLIPLLESPRRSGRGAGRDGSGGDCRRAVRAAPAERRTRALAAAVIVLVPLIGQLSGLANVRRRRHEGAPGRSRAVQQVEFLLPDRRLRARPRRLVAEPDVHGRAPRDAVHGHRLGGIDADPPGRAGSLERAVPPIRADGARVPPQVRTRDRATRDSTWRRPSTRSAARRFHGACHRTRRGTGSRDGPRVRRGARRRG